MLVYWLLMFISRYFIDVINAVQFDIRRKNYIIFSEYKIIKKSLAIPGIYYPTRDNATYIQSQA